MHDLDRPSASPLLTPGLVVIENSCNNNAQRASRPVGLNLKMFPRLNNSVIRVCLKLQHSPTFLCVGELVANVGSEQERLPPPDSMHRLEDHFLFRIWETEDRRFYEAIFQRCQFSPKGNVFCQIAEGPRNFPIIFDKFPVKPSQS